jgi:hypothetical protein
MAADDLYSGLNFDVDSRPSASDEALAAAGLGGGFGALPQGMPSGAPGSLGALRG